MLACLLNYIGVKGCGLPEPESGIYINSLPGISLKQIQSIANSEQVTFVAVWADVQERATNRLEMDFKSLFRRQYSENCCKPDCSIDDIICNSKVDLQRALTYALGIELMLEREFSERINYYTTVSKATAETLNGLYTAEYEASLKAVIQTIPQAILDDCFVCEGGQISYREMLP